MSRLSVSLRESLKIRKVLGDKVSNVKPASREMWPLEYIRQQDQHLQVGVLHKQTRVK